MSLIVDASIAVKWFSEEPDSDKADRLLASGEPFTAPELILAEIGNALRKKTISGLIRPDQALRAIAQTPSYFDRLVPAADIVARAFEFGIELKHPIYDCFYLALAERERLPLVSADAELVAKAKKLKGVTVRGL